MTLHNILNTAASGWGVVLMIIFLSLIQISPLKINPWDKIFQWIGDKINKDTQANIDKMQRKIDSMWVSAHRNLILKFARECRSNIEHSPDEWAYILNIAEEYENYTNENHISNGIIKQDTQFLRTLYQELSRERKI